MESLYLLVPLSVLTVFAAIWVFFRMSDSGQFDDVVGPALRVVQDDDFDMLALSRKSTDALRSDDKPA